MTSLDSFHSTTPMSAGDSHSTSLTSSTATMSDHHDSTHSHPPDTPTRRLRRWLVRCWLHALRAHSTLDLAWLDPSQQTQTALDLLARLVSGWMSGSKAMEREEAEWAQRCVEREERKQAEDAAREAEEKAAAEARQREQQAEEKKRAQLTPTMARMKKHGAVQPVKSVVTSPATSSATPSTAARPVAPVEDDPYGDAADVVYSYPHLMHELLSVHGKNWIDLLLGQCLMRPQQLLQGATKFMTDESSSSHDGMADGMRSNHVDDDDEVNPSLLASAFASPSSRRIGWTLVTISCMGGRLPLQRLLEWMSFAHGHEHGRLDVSLNRLTRRWENELAERHGWNTDDLDDLPDDDWEIDPASEARSSCGYVGLKNQAATCYQNSFLQMMFRIRQVREEILAVNEEEEEEEKVSGVIKKNDDSDDFDPSASLLSHLQHVFYTLKHSRLKYHDPIRFVRTFVGWDGRPFDPRVQQDVLEFCNMLFDRIETKLDTINKRKQKKQLNSANAVSSASSSSSSSIPPNVLKRYFGGQLTHELICEQHRLDPSCGHKFQRHEPFSVLSLVIQGSHTLEQCLNNFVAGEKLEGSNAYMCAMCGRKRGTEKRSLIHRWPRYTIFHLKRFEFDFQEMKVKKLNDEVSFPMEIDLQPYTEEGMEWKEKMEKEGTEEQKMQPEDGEAVVEQNGTYVQEQNNDDEAPLQHTLEPSNAWIFNPCIRCPRQSSHRCVECDAFMCAEHEEEIHTELAEQQRQEREAAAAEAAAQAAAVAASSTSSSLQPPPPKMYRLVGVLVHSGHAEGGHYYSYIRTESGEWVEFNDTLIQPFDPDRLGVEAFGGVEDDPTATSSSNANNNDPGMEGMKTVVNHRARRRRNRAQYYPPPSTDDSTTTDAASKPNTTKDGWQKGKMEKTRNAYLLWYEAVDPEPDETVVDQHMANGHCSSGHEIDPTDATLASALSNLSLSTLSTSSQSSLLDPSSLSHSSLFPPPPSALPRCLHPLHVHLFRENLMQLLREMIFERGYMEMMYAIARRNAEWMIRIPDDEAEAEQRMSDEADGMTAGHPFALDLPSPRATPPPDPRRYFPDLSMLERDASNDGDRDLFFQWSRSFALFYFETLIHARNAPRLDEWCLLLQHAFSVHVGASEWILDYFSEHPSKLVEIFLNCPTDSTRRQVTSILEVACKSLVRFEVDPSFNLSHHLILPPLKPIAKRVDAQANLAAALFEGGQKHAASTSLDESPLASSITQPMSSSSSSSFLSSALVQSASVQASIFPFAVLKPTAKATVSVSARVSVLDGVGKAVERQLNSVGIKTLQDLVEIRPEQRTAILDNTPIAGLQPDTLDKLIKNAQKAVDTILELSGINKQLEEERKKAEEEAAAIKAASLSSSSAPPSQPSSTAYFGPHILPRFFRSCLHVLNSVIETQGGSCKHVAPELCGLLANLARSNAHLLALLVEVGTVETCMHVIESPTRFDDEHNISKSSSSGSPTTSATIIDEDDPVAQVAAAEAEFARQEARRQRKAAADGSAPSQSPTLSRDGSAATSQTSTASTTETIEVDENVLDDLPYVRMVGLLEVLVRGCTTKSGKKEPMVQLLPGPPTLSPAVWKSLTSHRFFKRLVLQISDAKVDPPSSFATHVCWENMEASDRLLNAICECVADRDFFDFYTALKILQHFAVHVHDSLHQYRLELALPRLVSIASENRIYYKSTEILIKFLLHLFQHVPVARDWVRNHSSNLESIRWMESWLTKNRSMPKPSKDGSAPEGQALYICKGDSSECTQSWEKAWDEQIEDWGVGQGSQDNQSDYSKIWRKTMLSIQVSKDGRK